VPGIPPPGCARPSAWTARATRPRRPTPSHS